MMLESRNGTLVVPRKCVKCYGSGRIFQRIWNGPGDKIERTISCPRCKGTGTLLVDIDVVDMREANLMKKLGGKAQ